MEFKELVKNGEYENVMCIYKIENIVTGKVYTGSTNNLRRRINSHIRKLTENTHNNTQLQNSWNVCGIDKFQFEIVEIVEDESFLPYAELYYIEKYRRIKGVYNISDPLEEVRVLNNRNKPKKEKSEPKVKVKTSNTFIQSVLESEFEHLFIKLQEKVNECHCVEFVRIRDYIINKISLKDYDTTRIEDNIVRVIRKYDLCVYNLDSPIYDITILNQYGINNYVKSIISKDLAESLTKNKVATSN